VHVFLGVTGASGAPYAARLLRALGDAGCEIGVTASAAGVEVLATELYGDATLERDDVLQRFVGSTPNVTTYAVNDYKAPYASGSAKVDAYVVCPCSMSRHARRRRDGEPHPPRGVGGAEGGPQARARAARDAALVDSPERARDAADGRRHDPLRSARFLPRAQTIEDLVDFVVARILDQLGLDNSLVQRWGQ
jgi:4-hydroxy-3-polyprenylbenzoate decarboxylase